MRQRAIENIRVDDAAGSPRLEFGLGVARGAGRGTEGAE